jgi:hypothetical protein
VMTEVRASQRSGLDTGGAADGRSDEPIDMATEVAMAGAAIAASTAGEDTVVPIESQDNAMRRRRSEVPPTAWALGDGSSCMEHAAPQQAHELA